MKENSMPRLTDNLNETWELEDSEYDRWEVAEGVTVDALDGGNGIIDSSYGSDIVINGTVIARQNNASNFYAGVFSESDSSSVTIGKSGYINSTFVDFGVVTADGGDVRNYGVIEAVTAGIHGLKGTDVKNHGTIRAENGIAIGSGNFNILNTGLIVGSALGVQAHAGGFGILVNELGATIRGEDGGVRISGERGEFAKIINNGMIKGEDFAFYSSDATIEIVNRGTMVGDVSTGAGNDVIDTREGTIKGTLRGGDGNDVYIIGRSKIAIEEEGDGGVYDFVQSTFTYRLTDNVEALQLAGRKNINATGNAGDNILTGNVGNNTLSGGGGADALYSVQGDDRMTGGVGADAFVFGEEYDRDRITDFEDGLDRLYLLGVTNQQQFEALNIRKSGDDLIINYGRGDQLIIEDMRKQDLTIDDLLIT
jgi:Ca2+-binding RTX toxin-like protein